MNHTRPAAFHPRHYRKCDEEEEGKYDNNFLFLIEGHFWVPQCI